MEAATPHLQHILAGLDIMNGCLKRRANSIAAQQSIEECPVEDVVREVPAVDIARYHNKVLGDLLDPIGKLFGVTRVENYKINAVGLQLQFAEEELLESSVFTLAVDLHRLVDVLGVGVYVQDVQFLLNCRYEVAFVEFVHGQLDVFLGLLEFLDERLEHTVVLGLVLHYLHAIVLFLYIRAAPEETDPEEVV